VIVADANLPIVRRLSPGSAADDPEGQKLMEQIPKEICRRKPLLMDKAYEGNTCRAKAKKCGMRPVVPPKSNRRKPWRYNKKLYKQRNIVERNFRNIKEFRRVFTRYDKLDETCNAFSAVANIIVFLRN
jgi:transposase